MSMTLISTVTVGSDGAANIDFNSIPQTFTDLCLKVSPRSTSNASGTYSFMYLNFNAASTTLFSGRLLQGSGSGAGSFTLSGADTAQMAVVNGSSSTANTFSSVEVYIPNYRAASNKSLSIESVHETNATDAYQQIWAKLWSSTNAITSMSLTLNAGIFAQHSSASLYGITAGSSGGVIVS